MTGWESARKRQTAVVAARDGHQDGGGYDDYAGRYFEVGLGHEHLTEISAFQGGSAFAS